MHILCYKFSTSRSFLSPREISDYSSRSSPPRNRQRFFSLASPGRCLTKLERIYDLVCPTKNLSH